MINLGTETVKNSLVQPSGVTVFVPLDSAFQKVANIRWANLNSNQTLVDMVCIILVDKALLEQTPNPGGYGMYNPCG